MEHTFLIQPGKWRTTGTYIDASNNMSQVSGETNITHSDKWHIQSNIATENSGSEKILNNYQIEPLENGKDYTLWTSENPKVGKLNGKFVFVGSLILSSYISEDASYSGTETLRKLDDNRYATNGFLFKDNEKVSSWSFELQKID